MAQRPRLARQVQQRLFPPAPPSVPGLDEWGVSIPAHAHLTSTAILDALCDAIRFITGDRSQQDDITAIVCLVGAGELAVMPPRRRAGRRVRQ